MCLNSRINSTDYVFWKKKHVMNVCTDLRINGPFGYQSKYCNHRIINDRMDSTQTESLLIFDHELRVVQSGVLTRGTVQSIDK